MLKAKKDIQAADPDVGFRLHSRLSRHGLSSTTFYSSKGHQFITIFELASTGGFIVGGYLDTSIQSKHGLFFFALSSSSREDVLPPFKMKLNRPMDEMFKGQDTIPLNVHGTVMMTSRQTLELLVSEGKKNEMEVTADLSCLETILNQVKEHTTELQNKLYAHDNIKVNNPVE